MEITSTTIITIVSSVAKTINQYSTLILVIITGFYAWATFRMMKIMTKQVVADLQISNVRLGSVFVENWFKKGLKEGREESNAYFGLVFDITNRSAGAGSIEKPVLILKFKNNIKEYRKRPITKDSEFEREEGFIQHYKTVDSGGTIFLRGGDSENIELRYFFVLSKEFLNKLKDKPDLLEYYIRFKDNLGKKYQIKIKNIQSETSIFRE